MNVESRESKNNFAFAFREKNNKCLTKKTFRFSHFEIPSTHSGDRGKCYRCSLHARQKPIYRKCLMRKMLPLLIACICQSLKIHKLSSESRLSSIISSMYSSTVRAIWINYEKKDISYLLTAKIEDEMYAPVSQFERNSTTKITLLTELMEVKLAVTLFPGQLALF